MKLKHTLIIGCCIGNVFAYTQSDLLSTQYDYQLASDQLTLAKDEKQDAAKALEKAKKKFNDAQDAYKQAQQDLQNAQTRYANAESDIKAKTAKFGVVNNKLNQVWNDLNH